MTDKIIEILFKHEEPFQDTGLSFVPRWKYKTIAKELLEAINFIQCCESDSEQLKCECCGFEYERKELDYAPNGDLVCDDCTF